MIKLLFLEMELWNIEGKWVGRNYGDVAGVLFGF